MSGRRQVFSFVALIGAAFGFSIPAEAGETARLLGLRAEIDATVAAPVLDPAFASDPRPAVVSIVIDDLGLDEVATRAVIALPASLTLSFLPYGRRTAALAREAAAAGHEVFLHLPMEPKGLDDPGPGALTTWAGSGLVVGEAEAALARVPGAVGFNNHMGSRFTSCAACVQPLAAWASKRGLFVLDSVTDPRSRLADAARKAGAAGRRRDVFLDHDPRPEAVAAALAELERLARRQDRAVAIGHPKPATLEALETWLIAAPADRIDVAPLASPRRPLGLRADAAF